MYKFSLRMVLILLCLFCFLGPHPGHVEVSRLPVESELQLPSYTTATATQDPSHICNLHHSPRQHQITNPLSEAWNQTRNLMFPSRIRFRCAMMLTPACTYLFPRKLIHHYSRKNINLYIESSKIITMKIKQEILEKRQLWK